MLVRDARPGDGLRIEETRLLGWRAAYAGIVPRPFLDAMQLDPARVAARDAWAAAPVEGEVMLVAEDEGVVVGCAFVRPADEPGAAELAALYLDPAVWRRGIGSALLVEAFARVPQRHHVLWVLEGNERGRRFYEAHGFGPDGRRQVLDLQGPVPEVRYARST